MAGAVEDRVSDSTGATLAALAVYDPAGNVLLGIQAVDQEAVAGIDRINAAEVGDYHIALDASVLMYHLLEFFGLLVVELYTLLDIGHCKDLVRGHVSAALEQLFHELVIAYGEVAESAESSTRIHQEADKDPALRIQYLFTGEVSAVDLIDCFHEVVEVREAFLAAVVLIYNTRTARGDAAFTLVLTLVFSALLLAGVVIKPESAALHERNIRQYVIFGHRDQSVLKILRVGKCPGIRLDNSGTEQKCAAGKSIKIRTCNQSHDDTSLYKKIDKLIYLVRDKIPHQIHYSKYPHKNQHDFYKKPYLFALFLCSVTDFRYQLHYTDLPRETECAHGIDDDL